MSALLDLPGALARIALDAATQTALGGDPSPPTPLATTPRDTVFEDCSARVYRFRPAEGAPAAPRRPLLLVPSMINRWFVLDLRPGSSLAEALVASGLDVYLLDWGTPRDEDRFLSWPEVLDRLGRAVRFVRRNTGADRVGILGYCMGATLSSIYAALHPEQVAALVNLAGPIDFSHAGMLGHMVDPRWFDVEAITDAGNLPASQMQSGFSAMRPTLQLAKLVGQYDRLHVPGARQSLDAIERWGNDNIPFPAAAYRTYISELYQQNLLARGEHRVRGRVARLSDITCPVMAITAERDTICPPAAALALLSLSGSSDTRALSVPGGHVGAVVGSRASKELYPAVAQWLRERLDAPLPKTAATE